MKKLLIVDDEPLVQIGIKSMLNWADFGIEICGTAMNGKQALNLIEEYSPEIVITDIKMPIMDGLELIKLCRETYGSIPLFLVLTSYEEFPLIKQALSYQVVDYLIKLELDKERLQTAINQSLERLVQLQASEVLKKGNGGRPLLQSYSDKFFMRLLHNLFDSRKQFSIQAKDLHLDFSYRCYLAAHGEVQSKTASSMLHSQQVNLFSSSLQMLKEILGKYIPCHVIVLDMRHFAAIFYFSDLETMDISKIQKAWDNACIMVHNYFNVHLTVGIGSGVDDPLLISETYQEARQAFKQAGEKNPITFFRQSTNLSKSSFNIAIFKNALTQAFEEFDIDILYNTLTQIIELFSAHPQCFLQAMDGSCNILYLSMSMLPDGEETISQIFTEYPDGYRSIYQMKNIQQIIQWLTTFRDSLCATLKSKRKTYKEHLINSIQKYIDSHIEERLSLNDVAAVFGLSPNYLSTLFKKTCSIGFSEYITQGKISRAKNLLLEQDMKIYEIAEHLGFESAFYFSKVFKKVEGISPREYIQGHISGLKN